MPELEVRCSRCQSTLQHECHPDTLAEAALDLFMWRPEGGFPKALKKGNDWVDERVDDETIPFLTEAFLYALLGKEDARGLMGRIHGLFRAMGIESSVLEERACEILANKKRDQEAEEERRKKAREAYRQEMAPTARTPQNSGLTVCQYRSFHCFDTNVRRCERGLCFELVRPEVVSLGGKDRKTPKLSEPFFGDGGCLCVGCNLCKRIHMAPAAQVEGWSKEPRYQVNKGRGMRHPERTMKQQDYIAADCIRVALGFKPASEERAPG